jgi:class 3 adenylate cyclase
VTNPRVTIRETNASVELSADRRLAAIFAADVVGYRRLMGIDELGTLRALKAIRAEILEPEIAHYRGRLVKTTGDGLLVEFASVVYAVACAAAIQRDMTARASGVEADALVRLRIGVNMGDIISLGSDIYGDAVNLAARLESICEPGGLAISRAVHEQVRDKLAFPFADLGERRFKNIARPMQVFALTPHTIASTPETALEVRPGAAAAPITLKTAARPTRHARSLEPISMAAGAFAVPRVERVLRAIGTFFAVPHPDTPPPPVWPEPVGLPGRAIAARSPEPTETRIGAEVE